ncbi:hypothetical protein Asppvi_009945 [Aspergillus pseudoviridinutans]|uniref:Cytochrome P450 n=1 Tax=Aspergillus pseudoviridinutans TaxID=1517512 RepID=A0A9P3BGV2_9EURO|nr:uncharacterized protein Asppvi_009945 [Aspergillus pseudoviridinutans]GIJ90980.1 hypothetical protein Asppvi_009945 [Aspergillus pseudoviridinutans]
MPNPGLIRFKEFSSRPNLIVTSPEALVEVLSTRANDYVKPDGLRNFVARILGFGLLLSEGDVHKVQRRASQGFFKPQVLRLTYPVLWEKAKEMVRSLEQGIEEQSKQTKSMGNAGNFLLSELSRDITMDFIGLSTMGHDLKSFEDNPDKVVDNFSELTDPSLLQMVFLVLSVKVPEWMTDPFRWALDPSRLTAKRALRTFGERMVKERKALLALNPQASRGNLLDVLIGQGIFSDEELADQLVTILGAGHDTSASTLVWCCYELCRRPDIQQQLRTEIRGAIPSLLDTDAASWKTLESMPLLNAIIHEVLRLHPSVPMFTREAIKDTSILNYPIPKGTRVVICPRALNRLPEFWGEDADKFVPDRWIDTDESGERTLNGLGGAPTKYAHITFSHGNRSCIGKPIAFIQVRCALAAIFGRFNVELVDEEIPYQPPSFITMKPLESVPFRLTKVEGW